MEKAFLLGAGLSGLKTITHCRKSLEERGLNISFEAKDISQMALAQAFIQAKDFKFCLVEAPYKALSFEAADHAGITVQLARGANMLINLKNQLIAASTEGEAAIAYLEQAGFDFKGKNIVICGTGIMSLATLHSAVIHGADRLCLISRDKQRASARLKKYVSTLKEKVNLDLAFLSAGDAYRSLSDAFDQAEFMYADYKTSTKTLKEADLIINATPLGEKLADPSPFDTSLIMSEQWVLDCAVSEHETSLVREAKTKTNHVLDGNGLQKVVVETCLDLAEDLQ